MLRSLYTAVSGLQANQTMLDTVGNNVANINTVGFKGQDVEFEDLLTQQIAGASSPTTGLGGINSYDVGLGVRIAGTATDLSQGTSQNTGRPLDLSIQGDGFLITNDNGRALYTRAGQLSLDANGNLVTPDGMRVQGWTATGGVVSTTSPLGSLAIPSGSQIPATATANITLSGNVALTGTTPPTTSVSVYDALGNASTLTLAFAQDPKTGAWSVTGTQGTTTVGTAALSFNTNGTAATSSVKLGGYTLQIGNITANGGPATVAVANQDGASAWSLQSYSISTTGVIEGTYSNGQTQALGQIALAVFSNPGGLAHAGDTAFTATANSGLAQVGAPGSGQHGLIAPGTLEQSNVDLGKQFTELVTAERGYQANTKMVTTDDQILNDLVNMVQ